MAVLRFCGTGIEAEILGFGFALTLLEALEGTRRVRIVPARVSLAEGCCQRSPEEIVREMNAAVALTGDFAIDHGQLEINAVLIDTISERELWSEGYVGTCRDLGEIQHTLAGRLQHMTGERDRCSASRSHNAIDWQAFRAYASGRWLHERGDLDAAIAQYAASVTADPQYARTRAALAAALCTRWLDGGADDNALRARTKAAAEAALRIDRSLAEAQAAAGMVRAMDGDIVAASRHLRRAVRLDPVSPRIHRWYADVLEKAGRIDDASGERAWAAALEDRC